VHATIRVFGEAFQRQQDNYMETNYIDDALQENPQNTGSGGNRSEISSRGRS